MPLRIAVSKKGFKKRDRKNFLELSKTYCFKIGLASSENFISADALSKHFTVRAQTAMTISAVSKDPRSHSVLGQGLSDDGDDKLLKPTDGVV